MPKAKKDNGGEPSQKQGGAVIGKTKLDVFEQAAEARGGEDAEDGGLKAGEKSGGGTLYGGQLTCESVSSETDEKISFRMTIPEAQPVTEEGVWNRFKVYQPSAMREHFKIDAENKIDPNLRMSRDGVPVKTPEQVAKEKL